MTVTLPCATSARWSDRPPRSRAHRHDARTVGPRRALTRRFWVSTGLWNRPINGGGTAPRVEIIESSGIFDEGYRPSTPRPAGAAGRDDRDAAPQRTEGFGRGPERFRGERSCRSPSTPHDHHHAEQSLTARTPARGGLTAGPSPTRQHTLNRLFTIPERPGRTRPCPTPACPPPSGWPP